MFFVCVLCGKTVFVRFAAHVASGLSLGSDREAEPARFCHLESAGAPLGVMRLRVQRDSRLLGLGGELIDVLLGADISASPHLSAGRAPSSNRPG